MATALIHDLDDDAYERLKARAAGNNRSLEAELREILVLASKQVALGADAPLAEAGAAPTEMPIWEVFDDENRAIPPEVWDALPSDLSARHDDHVYGMPKRTAP